MNFLAIDVETANADYSSICQIGLVHFQDGQIVDKWSSLVNPEAYFDPFNSSIHGITEEAVQNAPTFDAIHSLISEKITNQITIHHMPFDRIAVTRACTEYNLEIIQPKWLDSAKIVRRTWDQFAYKGYGLANIADFLDIQFGHHDALEDAIAAAKIVHIACEKTQRTVEDWLTRVDQPIFPYQSGSSAIRLDGNSEGALYGENLVFTGALSIPRKDAAKIAADIGCNIRNSVSKKTTILVVGTHDTSKLAGYEKSSKHRKVEELIENGISIKILSEKDFIEMCNNENKELQLEVPKKEAKPQKVNKQKRPVNQSDIHLEIKIDEKFISEIKNKLNSLTDEQKVALQKSKQIYQKQLSSIKECSQEEKRKLATEFKSNIVKVKEYYDILRIESYEVDLVDTIDMEIEQLQDLLYDLMKDKITLVELFETIEFSLNIIKSDFEDVSYPKPINDYCILTMKELKKIKLRIKSFAVVS
ncbi:exonuclease domain-containing protein [Balneola vulgaris]|uniref:exonuclease domain-containing protein n=1 Tax=Balneola vulgaris TaxID=287535 RepID=UPI0003606377|nr:exonuclease domain-containing protein [Balneola vulgaris]